MKKISRLTLFFFLFFFMASLSSAGNRYYYKTYDMKTQAVSNKTEITVGDIVNKERQVRAVYTGLHHSSEEEYLLDKNDAAMTFTVKNNSDDTNYNGYRKERELILVGRFKGKSIDKRVHIDRNPFYANPRVSLRHFILSDKKKIVFWTIRPEDLAVYRVVAVKRGRARPILVRGQKIQAVKVTLAPTGILAFFFKRLLWFRESDGVCVSQKLPGGKTRELIEERNMGEN